MHQKAYFLHEQYVFNTMISSRKTRNMAQLFEVAMAKLYVIFVSIEFRNDWVNTLIFVCRFTSAKLDTVVPCITI